LEYKRLGLIVLLLVGLLAIPFAVTPVRGQTLVNLQKTITSSTNDGFIAVLVSSNYDYSWTSTIGSVFDSLDYIGVGQNASNHIYRAFLFFSMNDLPSDAVITEAWVGVRISYAQLNVDNFTLTVCDGQPTYPHDPLAYTDYNRLLYNSMSSGNSTTAVVVDNYFYVNYTAADLSRIETSGTTKVVLRSDQEIVGNSTNQATLTFWGANKGESCAPVLIVNYNTYAYAYTFHGPFLETGVASTDNVTVVVYPVGAASSTFDMPANSSYIHNIYFSTGPLHHFSYNITSPVYNVSRIYYVESAETDFYLFLPKSTDSYAQYSFQIVDLAGLGAGYISTNLNINGTSRPVEKLPIDLYNYMNFYLVKGNTYDIKVSCSLGVFTDANFVAAETLTKKEVITGDMFARSMPSNPLAVAGRRQNATWIQANYSNIEATTDWIQFTIQRLITTTWTTVVVSNNTLNATSMQYNWYSAGNTTDYRMTVLASISSVEYTWMFDLSAPIVNVSPFDLSVLGTFGPFPTQHIIGFLLVCIAFGCFTAFDLGLGCTVAWIMSLFFTYLGLLPNATQNWILMGFAGFFVVLVDIKEAKKVEREI